MISQHPAVVCLGETLDPHWLLTSLCREANRKDNFPPGSSLSITLLPLFISQVLIILALCGQTLTNPLLHTRLTKAWELLGRFYPRAAAQAHKHTQQDHIHRYTCKVPLCAHKALFTVQADLHTQHSHTHTHTHNDPQHSHMHTDQQTHNSLQNTHSLTRKKLLK